MKFRDSIVLQTAYVVYAIVAIWFMIDWPFAHSSANDRINGRFFGDLVLIGWSLYMFVTGFIDLVSDMRSKERPNRAVHRSAAIRIALSVLFVLSAQWFFVQAVLDYLN